MPLLTLSHSFCLRPFILQTIVKRVQVCFCLSQETVINYLLEDDVRDVAPQRPGSFSENAKFLF